MTATPATASTPQQTAARVEELLERLAAQDPAVAATAEELVRALMEFYGAGLARAVALLSGRSGAPLGALLDDEVTAGLLVLHDLHPDDLPTRVDRALRAAEAGTVEIVALDEQLGRVTLREAQAGHGCGCPSTNASLQQRIEASLSCFAPEITTVEIAAAEPARREPALLQIGLRPGAAAEAR
ncbi:NifU family protein [Streptacidiphilus jiangxiensis]|uniref:NifU-like domain-containing protein n=1 Tax=Streptacidiphilus jiangxiensis TaxID=235985 RepID=A0A1H7NEA9_STRJI|nr:NifU family protein [Streptacidiphilus jiangxiensis]SEL21661.1 NifU-like domain-containing protein [Streptacidiphilus jiangxiensis]